jgi:hypothetical protein
MYATLAVAVMFKHTHAKVIAREIKMSQLKLLFLQMHDTMQRAQFEWRLEGIIITAAARAINNTNNNNNFVIFTIYSQLCDIHTYLLSFYHSIYLAHK